MTNRDARPQQRLAPLAGFVAATAVVAGCWLASNAWPGSLSCAAWMDDLNASAHVTQISNYLQDMELATEMPEGPDPKSFAASVDDYCSAHPQDRLKAAIASAFAKFDRESPVL